MNYLPLILTLVVLITFTVLFAVLIRVAITLRRVVPTNMVHIVQSSKSTESFGKGQSTGNVYYRWPAWLPVLGVSVIELPESIFQVSLINYEAYDKARLPFTVDVTAFFRVESSSQVANRVASFQELHNQLDSVLKGAVRRVLATNDLPHIMEARLSLGDEFTKEVRSQIQEWGVTTVKTIEFMDLRDSANSKVIANIMAKEQSRIDQESRIAVAENRRKAESAEIAYKRDVELQAQESQQQVGLRTADRERTVGIANEKSKQEIQEAAAITAEKQMQVKRIESERAAEIAKSVSITNAESSLATAQLEKEVTIANAEAASERRALESEGELRAVNNRAQGAKAEGLAAAEAETARLMAPVTAQIALAEKIEKSEAYLKYLVQQLQVEAARAVGLGMTGAMEKAEIKILSGGNPGDLAGGVSNVLELFSSKGGMGIMGLMEALSQSEPGKALIQRITGKSDAATIE